jgi:hypothetical protein
MASTATAPCCSISYGINKLLLLVKVFMKVSCDAEHSTDKKAEMFWEEVSNVFEEYVATAN